MNNTTSIKYLSHKRFKVIYDLLNSGKASWEICGELLYGKPITEEEIRFVAIKTGVVCN